MFFDESFFEAWFVQVATFSTASMVRILFIDALNVVWERFREWIGSFKHLLRGI